MITATSATGTKGAMARLEQSSLLKKAGNVGILTDVRRLPHTNSATIGTTSPARKLHISDAMRLEPIASPPSSPSSGDLYFDNSEALCVYVNSAWAKIAGSGTCA